MLGSERYHRSRQRAAVISVIVGFLMLVLKMTAFVETSSAAILSDALESVVHVLATVFMFFCFRLVATPPDANHPYGHGKAEPLSVGVEGGMILLAAFAIICSIILHLLHSDHRVQKVDLGVVLITACALGNLCLGIYLLHTGKASNSKILIADGHHVLSDVWNSGGVLASLILMWWVQNDHLRMLIDSLTALFIAVMIIITAMKLLRRSIAGLLDEVNSPLLQRVVDAINEIRQPTWLDVHNLRLRSSGDITHIDFHMTVPGDWTIAEGHAAEERIQSHILERLNSRGSVIIHFDYPHEGPLPPLPPESPHSQGVPALPALTLAAAVRTTA